MISPKTYPTVSIILTSYNAAAFIRDTVGSIIAQTYAHWELIVGDDGSTDDTLILIESIGDERIHCLRLPHSGINGAVKNKCIASARGEWLAFIDHDDLWHPSKLEKQFAAMSACPAAGFCLTGGFNFTDKEATLEYFYRQNAGARHGMLFQAIFRSEVAPLVQSLLVRRDTLKGSVKFNETTGFGDTEFILNLAHDFPGVVLYEPLLQRRIHAGNYSRGNWISGHRQGMMLIRYFARKGWLSRVEARDALFRSAIHFGERCIERKRRGLALISFLCAWRERPSSLVPMKKTGRLLFSYLAPVKTLLR